MRQTIEMPRFKLKKTPVPSVEIDMWSIQGEYADGKWHELIRNYTKRWIFENDFKDRATLWSVVLPSANFHHQGNSCFIVGCCTPDRFLNGLVEFVSEKFPKQVRMSDEVIATRNDGWKPYLHLEQGKVWEYCDDIEWIEC